MCNLGSFLAIDRVLALLHSYLMVVRFYELINKVYHPSPSTMGSYPLAHQRLFNRIFNGKHKAVSSSSPHRTVMIPCADTVKRTGTEAQHVNVFRVVTIHQSSLRPDTGPRHDLSRKSKALIMIGSGQSIPENQLVRVGFPFFTAPGELSVLNNEEVKGETVVSRKILAHEP